jgi:hypothetical protein
MAVRDEGGRSRTALRVAAGLDDSELKFKRHIVSVEPVTQKLAV